jgi:release factor glutamine methyltransferase
VRVISVPGVFQPRSDTWMLIDVLRAETLPPGARVLDLCSGSGAIGVAAALAGATVTSVDVSRRALLSAWLNARANGVRVRRRRGSLFAAVPGERFDLILTNPPYLPAEDDALPARGPQRAWDAGRNGRALLDPLCDEVPAHLRPGGSVLIIHSSVCDIGATERALAAGGLEVEIVARHRGPLGPLLRARVDHLRAVGGLPPGSLSEDVVVIRGRRPAAAAAPVRLAS